MINKKNSIKVKKFIRKALDESKATMKSKQCDHKSTKREEIKISFSLKEKKSNLRMSVFLQENWIQSE